MNEEIKKLRLLYIGSDEEVIAKINAYPGFETIVKPHPLAAIYWLTDNTYRLFDLDQEIRSQTHYEENQSIDGIVCEYYTSGINAFTFFRRLRFFKIYQKVPYIVFYPSYDRFRKTEAFSMEIDDFYEHNISADRLHSRLEFLKVMKTDVKPAPLISDNEDTAPYKTPFLKRSFDLILAGIALLLLSPLMIVVMVAIRLESKGKVYYFSKRVGANYRIFDFYKFRSMYPDADKRLKEVEHLNQYMGEKVEDKCSECAKLQEGQTCSPLVYYDGEEICERLANKRRKAKKAFLKVQDDPRITRVGKFIRMTSIDELPQLINVMKGDMSIVGNRPLPLNEAESLTKRKWSRRFRAAAGLTGLWQVEKRGRGGVMSEEERFALDNYYAEHNSFWGDIIIIFRTFKALFQKENV